MKKRILITDEDKREFLFWVIGLIHGGIPQDFGQLGSIKGFCALGFGIVCTKAEGLTNGLEPVISEEQVSKWLYKIIQKFDYLKENNREYGIVGLNDGLNLSFPEIGEILLKTHSKELGLSKKDVEQILKPA